MTMCSQARIALMGMFALCLLGLLAGSVFAAVAPPLNKVGATTMTAAQYTKDGKVVGPLMELIDGNATTRWMCRDGALPLYLVFDLGTARTVGKLRIANYYSGGKNLERGFKVVDVFVGDIFYAPMAVNTLPAQAVADQNVTISTATGTAWTDITLAKPVKGRYVTVLVKSNWGGNAYAANEVEIYTVEGDATGAVVTPTSATGTSSASTTASATQYDTAGAVIGSPKELVDHNPDTRWNYRGNGMPIRLMFDLGKVETITQVRIANYSSPSHGNLERGIKTVDLFASDTLAPTTGGTPTVPNAQIAISTATGPAWTTITLPKPVQARYFTLRVTANWGGNAFAFNEVEFLTMPVNTLKTN